MAVTLSASLVEHWQAFSAMLHASAQLYFTSRTSMHSDSIAQMGACACPSFAHASGAMTDKSARLKWSRAHRQWCCVQVLRDPRWQSVLQAGRATVNEVIVRMLPKAPIAEESLTAPAQPYAVVVHQSPAPVTSRHQYHGIVVHSLSTTDAPRRV